MKRIGVLLEQELETWPGVRMGRMFGLRSVYRDGVIFAMLPDKRSFETADAVAYKEGGQWKVFEVADESRIGAALGVLEKAYAKSAG